VERPFPLLGHLRSTEGRTWAKSPSSVNSAIGKCREPGTSLRLSGDSDNNNRAFSESSNLSKHVSRSHHFCALKCWFNLGEIAAHPYGCSPICVRRAWVWKVVFSPRPVHATSPCPLEAKSWSQPWEQCRHGSGYPTPSVGLSVITW